MDSNDPDENWKYPGEKPGAFTFNNGVNPHFSPGIEGCQIGKDEWFAQGVPVGQILHAGDIPECCRPAPPVAGEYFWGYYVNTPGTTTWPLFPSASENFVCFMLMFFHPATVTIPAGYTLALDSEIVASNYCRIVVFWKRYTSYAPTSASWTIVGPVATAFGFGIVGGPAYTGVIAAASNTYPSDVILTAPTLTPTNYNQTVASVWFGSPGEFWTLPGGWTIQNAQTGSPGPERAQSTHRLIPSGPMPTLDMHSPEGVPSTCIALSLLIE